MALNGVADAALHFLVAFRDRVVMLLNVFLNTGNLVKQIKASIFILAVSLPLMGCLNQTKTDVASVPHAFSPSVAPDPGVLLMLVTNDQLLTAPEITVWVDAAAEEGVRLQAVTDKQFMKLGPNALRYAGLILPDESHRFADHALVAAIKSYTKAGGKTFLVFDFAALEPGAFNLQFYSDHRSRLSDLAGVHYLLYDELRNRTTAAGPVIATPATMRKLLVPPGKSIPYEPQPLTSNAATPDRKSVV